MTLIEALSDIYEVVIVLTGAIGTGSSLPIFAGVPCRVILVAADRPDADAVDAARAFVANLGFNAVEDIAAPRWQAQVA